MTAIQPDLTTTTLPGAARASRRRTPAVVAAGLVAAAAITTGIVAAVITSDDPVTTPASVGAVQSGTAVEAGDSAFINGTGFDAAIAGELARLSEAGGSASFLEPDVFNEALAQGLAGKGSGELDKIGTGPR